MTAYQIDNLEGMTPEQIDEAHRAGRLDALTGVPAADVAVLDKARTGQHITTADVAHLRRLGRPDLITAAHTEGRIITTTEGENRA